MSPPIRGEGIINYREDRSGLGDKLCVYGRVLVLLEILRDHVQDSTVD